MGIAPKEFEHLHQTLTHVIHRAASVSFEDPYETVYRANVLGCHNALTFSLALQETPGSPFVNHIFILNEPRLADGLERLGTIFGRAREHDALPRGALVTWMPISTRSDEDNRLSNQITMACVSLATDIADPVQRFRTIQASALAAKQEVTDRSREVTEWVTLWRGGSPVLTNLLGADHLLPPAANLTISNVPGISKDFYFHGAKLEAVYPLSVLVGTMGLNITLLSCGDTLAVGLLACPDTVPELDSLAAYLGDAFSEFQYLFSSPQNSAAVPTKSKRRKRRM